MIAIRCTALSCERPHWTRMPAAVENISLELQEGMLHGIFGAEGSGHTLLAHLLSLLEVPDRGSVGLFSQRIPDDAEVRAQMRTTIFGYVFANPCLLPGMSVAENIAMPLFRLAQSDEHQATLRVSELLELFGLEGLGNDEASRLPEDIQHAVALCRALVHRPRVVALIEPARPRPLLPLVRLAVEQFGLTGIWSSSDKSIACGVDRELTLNDGRVAAERLSFS